MKYLVFFLTLFVAVPIGSQLARTNKSVEKLVHFLYIFLTTEEITINFVSREFFKGTSRGFEVGIVDLLGLVLYSVILMRASKYPPRIVPPGAPIYFILFTFCLISITNSATGYIMHSFFEIWKMFRMYLYFWINYNYIIYYHNYDTIIYSIRAIIFYISYHVLRQKYVLGLWQAKGPFPHQNSLVMYMIILNSLILGYILNKKKKIKLFWWVVAFSLGSLSIVSTFSRAGLVCFVLSCMVIIMLSFTGGVSPRKIGVTILIMFIGLLGALRAMDSIVKRFETAPENSANTRKMLATAAIKMANDKTFGVGLNNFGVKINPPYNYSSHIEGVTEESIGGLVETIYLSYAAETGWHNMVIYFVLLFYFYFKNLNNFVKHRKSDYIWVPIGLAGGLMGIYLESALEWVLKQSNNFYQLMLCFALIGSMERMYKRKQATKKILWRNKMIEAKRMERERGNITIPHY
ncbi:MAG: O-antigen ligase family protein [Candidatus Cloacimonetes bacterium]|nr:O-antigen ligase family protein [Candidatus Cloacimonadota bacterium]